MGTATIYSIKSMEDYNYIQYKEHGRLQLYTALGVRGLRNYIQYKEHGGLQLYTV